MFIELTNERKEARIANIVLGIDGLNSFVSIPIVIGILRLKLSDKSPAHRQYPTHLKITTTGYR
ncbi:MAG: hypothetical protein J5I91_04515 [Bacteroidetes bacterium]|nr:hypothetical protein [Bacteroidota bacterium]